MPLTAEEAGKRGFSEIEAFKHVRALTQVGPHPVGSEALQVGSSTLLIFFSHCCCSYFLLFINSLDHNHQE